MTALNRCPFVRAVAEGRLDDARQLASAPPDPAEPVVVDCLIQQARWVLEDRLTLDLEPQEHYL